MPADEEALDEGQQRQHEAIFARHLDHQDDSREWRAHDRGEKGRHPDDGEVRVVAEAAHLAEHTGERVRELRRIAPELRARRTGSSSR